MIYLIFLILLFSVGCASDSEKSTTGFDERKINSMPEKSLADAKQQARKIHGQHARTLFCDCRFNRLQRIKTSTCHFSSKSKRPRLVYDHIIPRKEFAANLKCWNTPQRFKSCIKSNGKAMSPQQCCRRVSKIYRLMETDIHNLAPMIDEVNNNRRRLTLGTVSPETKTDGDCGFEVDPLRQSYIPGVHSRGDIARVYMYFVQIFGIRIDASKEKLLRRWMRQDPAEQWEKKKNRLVKSMQGFGIQSLEEGDHPLADADAEKVIDIEVLKLVRHLGSENSSLVNLIKERNPLALKQITAFPAEHGEKPPGFGPLATQSAALLAVMLVDNHKELIYKTNGSPYVVTTRDGSKSIDTRYVTQKTLLRIANGDDDHLGLFQVYLNWLIHAGVERHYFSFNRRKAKKPFRVLQGNLSALAEEFPGLMDIGVRKKMRDILFHTYIFNKNLHQPGDWSITGHQGTDEKIRSAMQEFVTSLQKHEHDKPLTPELRLRLIRYFDEQDRFSITRFELAYLKEYYAGVFF